MNRELSLAELAAGSRQSGQGQAGRLSGSSDRKTALILIPEDIAAEEPSISEQAAQLRSQNWEVLLVSEDAACEKEGVPEGADRLTQKKLPADTKLVLAIMDQRHAADLASGRQDTIYDWVCLRALWMGIPVAMDTQEVLCPDGLEGVNAALKKIYEDALRTLEKMGISRSDRENWAKLGGAAGGVAQTMHAPAGGEKTVITAKDVKERAESGQEWILPEDAIVTMLAEQEAKKRGIILTRRRN